MESEQVHDSLTCLDLALKAAGMGTFTYNVNDKSIQCDAQTLKLLGITDYENFFRHFFDNVHPDDREEIKTLLFLSISKLKDFEAEYRVIWRDGSVHYIVARAKIICDEEKNALRLSGLIWDVTEQKSLELNLHENLRKMNSIINNLDGVVFRFRLDDEMTMQYISQGVEKITGYPFWDFQMNKKRSFHSLIPESDRKDLLMAIMESAQKNCQYVSEYRIISSVGKQKWLSERGHCLIAGENDIVVEGIITDITEKKSIEAKLNRSLRQLKQLNQYLHKVRENERVAISRELHDDLGQALTAVRIDLKSLRDTIYEQPEALKKIDKIYSLVGTTIRSVQNMTAQLRPQIIDDLGLNAAIEWYSGDFSSRTGIRVSLQVEQLPDISSDTSLVIFRILQESLTNIARHANATEAGINLSVADHSIIMKVSDNGKGVSEQELRSKKSFGLISMRERAASLGGMLKFAVPEKGGTKVTLIIPYTARKQNEDPDM